MRLKQYEAVVDFKAIVVPASPSGNRSRRSGAKGDDAALSKLVVDSGRESEMHSGRRSILRGMDPTITNNSWALQHLCLNAIDLQKSTSNYVWAIEIDTDLDQRRHHRVQNWDLSLPGTSFSQ